MGYESRIIVIRKSDQLIEEGFLYAETMAIYNMRVFPAFQDLFNTDSPATKYAPYSQDDGDIEITEDNYGDHLRERTLEEVIECLNNYINENPDGEIYVRVRPLKAMLEEFVKIQNDYYKLVVLHYGC